MGRELEKQQRMGLVWSAIRNLLFAKKLEMVLVGLENSGKSTLLGMMSEGRAVETIPTVGLAMKQFRHGGTSIKCWDLGGQEKFRQEWARYSRGVDVILFVVDSADVNKVSVAKKELHQLLEHEELARIPVLVISNKIDLEGHVSRSDLVKELNLDYVTENAWELVEISALRATNLESVFAWLMKQQKRS
eukprot:c11093_g1_i2.p1 GENE.c11093_g1_i2~~c11093_g1_i2.p1  ORF type:complete len:190 (+),score=53.98 c11093_g1_i2:1-570(+)